MKGKKGKRGGGRGKSNAAPADKLAYLGPGPMNIIRPPLSPPQINSNLCVSKVFRFVSTAGSDGTSYSISPTKLCALISTGLTSTTVGQVFETVKVRWITLWTSADQSSGIFIPRTGAIEYSGTTLGIVGPQAMTSCMSVGATRVGIVKARPPRDSQAAQWQSGATNASNLIFNIIAGTGAILDIKLDLMVTANARSNATTTVTGPATVGQIYWLALDNNAGGALSSSDVWVPMPELLSVNFADYFKNVRHPFHMKTLPTKI